MTSVERDMLISRVVDGLATDADWRGLEAVGDADPSVWRELAVAQRQHAVLCGLVGRAIECADAVETPDPRPAVIRFPGSTWKWSGWAAAAMVAVAWMVGPRTADRQFQSPGPRLETAGMMPVSLAPEEHLQSYIENGRREGLVVGQIDTKPVIEVRPVKLENGTAFDVVYARVILERTRLPDVYRLTTDEFGTTGLVRAKLPERTISRPPM
jgi:hypothetical protein